MGGIMSASGGRRPRASGPHWVVDLQLAPSTHMTLGEHERQRTTDHGNYRVAGRHEQAEAGRGEPWGPPAASGVGATLECEQDKNTTDKNTQHGFHPNGAGVIERAIG